MSVNVCGIWVIRSGHLVVFFCKRCEVALRPCSINVTASFTFSTNLSRTMTTDNRLLCEGERVPEKDVENPGDRNNQKTESRSSSTPAEGRHRDLVTV